MHWRLGLDLGTNSLGWWAFRVTKEGARWRVVESLDGGVRIFSDGREPSKGGRVGDSLAVGRRLARSMRRNRDRGKNRLDELITTLVDLELLPTEADERQQLFGNKKGDTDCHNPYRLRSEAVEHPLSPHELGRALQHLGLRRGFLSNRKEASDDDGGKLKERIDRMHDALGDLTLGQMMWRRFQAENEIEKKTKHRSGIRFRGESEFYPDRAMYESEFNRIKEVQFDCHDLSEADWCRIRDRSILFQHPLKAVERGKCEFFADEPRHWLDAPISHEFRIYQELNALRWIDEQLASHRLDNEQREKVLEALLTRKSEVKFASLRKLKRSDKSQLFPTTSRFNLENEKRKGLKHHGIAARFAADPILAPLWLAHQEDDPALDEIFEVLHGENDDRKLADRLTKEYGLNDEQAKSLANLNFASGTGHVSRKFMAKIVPVLRDQGLVYSDAVAELTDDQGNPLHHSLRDDNRRWSKLPYYGEVLAQSMLGADSGVDPEKNPEKHFGKINNPTVHVALNQMRRVVNELVERYGSAPVEINVELTRELKQPRKRRDEITKQQAVNQRENERIKRDICAPNGIADPSALDIKKVKLWEELGKGELARRCVFTGLTISAAQLFNGEVEIEHLLPFKRTLDDSRSNLTISMRWANRLKGNNTPFEAFHSDQWAEKGIVWDEILQRVENLPGNKRWRFSEGAMDRYEADGGFIARQLTDTAYMARASQRYLKALDGVEQVVPNPGQLTHLIRGKWHLNRLLNTENSKSREDHRHHAVDAAVIALTDRAVLNEISRLTARGADDRVHLAVPELDPNLRKAIEDRVDTMIVSYKPDHGTVGRMYKDTAYGFVPQELRDPDMPNHNLVTRKALPQLTPKECEAIRDPDLRQKVCEWLEVAKRAGEKHEKALVEFSKEHGVKRVRLLIAGQTVQPVPSARYKGYASDSYVCCDIWRVPKGKPGRWKKDAFEWVGSFWAYSETISCAKGERPDKETKRPHPAAKFVMRVFKDDLVTFQDGGQNPIMRVAGFSTTNNILDLKPQHATDAPRKFISINVLGSQHLKKYAVTPAGAPYRTPKNYPS